MNRASTAGAAGAVGLILAVVGAAVSGPSAVAHVATASTTATSAPTAVTTATTTPPPFSPQGVGAPQVAVTPDGYTQLVFWRDTATNLLAEAWYTGVWNGPVEFPQMGTLSSAPAVAVTKDGSTQLVFWEGLAGQLTEAWFTGGTWYGPLDVDTRFTSGFADLNSAPSVTTTRDGSQLVFWREFDGHLGEAWYSNGGWTTTSCLGCPVTFLGSMESAPSSSATADGSTQLVFYQGAGGHLLETWYTGRWNGPADWTDKAFGGAGPLTSSPSATVTADGSTQLVFWQGTGNTLWEAWYAGGAWHGPVNWSGS